MSVHVAFGSGVVFISSGLCQFNVQRNIFKNYFLPGIQNDNGENEEVVNLLDIIKSKQRASKPRFIKNVQIFSNVHQVILYSCVILGKF